MMKPRRFDRNLIVIGAGSTGLVAAYIAAAVKAKVTLIEQHRMGGDCLNTGCVPSKALIRTAKLLADMKRAEALGVRRAAFELDFADVMERVQRVIRTVAPHDSVERYTALGVECLIGRARLTSPWSVAIAQPDGTRTLTTRSIIIATGARPLVPPIPGIEKAHCVTSDTVWELRTLPRRLLVLGGGPIGCELAQCFARFGSEVTQVEMAPRILLREDPEIVEMVAQQLRADGVRMLTGHKALRIEADASGTGLVAQSASAEVRVPFDVLLSAVGRVPNTEGYGLEELGIGLTRQRTIQTNAYLQTIHPNIYACGDVAGPYQFTHTGSHQAWYGAVNALFGGVKKFRADYSVIPWCTFTDPELARVGLNESEAREKGIAHEVVRYAIDDLDRAIADEEARGEVKVLTVPGKDRILGATICGSHAGDLIIEFITAMKNGIGLNRILGTIHIYPTLAEANKMAAGVWKRTHAPLGLLRWVERYHAWRRG
jgi:pyruvate/2-oxoglutarate dehydrogenase complex dihydrolipoamide dehydrogenase (E3) component